MTYSTNNRKRNLDVVVGDSITVYELVVYRTIVQTVDTSY